MSIDEAAPVAPAAVVETHISTLFFVGDRVYKLKKPVQLPFVDLSDRSSRERLCHREVELNRRISPDVYLGVADVSGPEGEPCDHLVVMRRLPAERRLSTLVAHASDEVPAILGALAEQLAAFHAGAARGADIARAGDVSAVRARWADLVTEIRACDPHLVDQDELSAVEGLVDQYCGGRRSLFERRVQDGCICDGHGDIQADDVFCLPDGPRLLDCVEFDDRLRWVDVADDVAFLAMDLERLGAPGLADRFVTDYERASGRELPRSLLDFYIAYRALVRCMVACTRAEQAGGEVATRAGERARSFLGLSHRRLRLALPRLVLVGGLPGTGKTTVAAGLVAQVPQSLLLRSDVVRKELAGLDPGSPAASGFDSGIYDASMTDRVYEELGRRARRALAAGRTVVVDASFQAEPFRQLLHGVAVESASPAIDLRCELDAAAANERIRGRLTAGRDASDATPEIRAAMADRFDAWPSAIKVDTSVPAATAVEVAARAVRG